MIARFFRFILASLFFAILSAFLVLAAALTAARAPGPLATNKIIVLDRGLGAREMAATLESNGIIRHRYLFLLSAILAGDLSRLQAGEYEFVARVSTTSALAKIANGDVYQRKLTIPEGLSVQEIAVLIENAPGLVEPGPASWPQEGGFLPETYLYTWGVTRADMAARISRAMDAAVKKLWDSRPADFMLKDINQVVTLASIIEKETGQAGERPHVAGVFFNRLRLGMKLQSDPTVIYAMTKGAPGGLARPLLTGDLEKTNSPYNTYLYGGLPPGPIANPGRDSLHAVFAPLKTDDLYFVADGTGGHAFARTLEGHNANVARWRALQRQKAGP